MARCRRLWPLLGASGKYRLGTLSLRVLGPAQLMGAFVGIIRTLGLGGLPLWPVGVRESVLVLGSYGGCDPPGLSSRACRIYSSSGPDRLDTARPRRGLRTQ